MPKQTDESKRGTQVPAALNPSELRRLQILATRRGAARGVVLREALLQMLDREDIQDDGIRPAAKSGLTR